MANGKLKTIYKLSGLDCASCATMLELDLEDVGIKCKCNYAKSEIEIQGNYNSKKVTRIIQKSGYSIASK
jgi:translation initiation factor 1 (eIF-1/SUI1)